MRSSDYVYLYINVYVSYIVICFCSILVEFPVWRVASTRSLTCTKEIGDFNVASSLCNTWVQEYRWRWEERVYECRGFWAFEGFSHPTKVEIPEDEPVEQIRGCLGVTVYKL